MSDRIQPGAEIDKQLWERFREDIKARKGCIRGNLRSELETAIREYLREGDNATLQEMNARMARLENAVGVASADGGVDLPEDGTHTRAEPSSPETVEEKPSSNAPTGRKVAYLATQAREQLGVGKDKPTMIPKSVLRDLVVDEYGFRRDTAKRYVGRLVDEFGLRPHPDSNVDQLVTESRYDQIIEQHREQAREELESAES